MFIVDRPKSQQYIKKLYKMYTYKSLGRLELQSKTAKIVFIDSKLDIRDASVNYNLAMPAFLFLLPIITLLISLGLLGLIE